LTTWLVKTYEAVFVTDLDVKAMMQSDRNAKNKQDAAWRQSSRHLGYKADLYGCHTIQVEPPGTTRECVWWLFVNYPV
jgi:putative transposase